MTNYETVEKNKWNELIITKEIISKPFHANKSLLYYALINNKLDIVKKILKLDNKNYKLLNQQIFIILCTLYNFQILLDFIELVDDEGKKYIFEPLDDDWFILLFIQNASLSMIEKLLKYKKYIGFDIIIDNYYILRVFLKKWYVEKNTKHSIKVLNDLIKLSKSSIKKNINTFSLIIDGCLFGFNKEILDILSKHFPECIGNSNNKLMTPLISSLTVKNDELSKYIIDCMKNKKYTKDYNYFGTTCALILSIRNNNNEILTQLLAFDDIDVNVHDIYKWSVAHMCFLSNSRISIENKKIILTKTTNVNSPNLNGNTVIHLLCLHQLIKEYEQVLNTKIIDLFYTNILGYTPLQYLDIHSNNKQLLYKIVATGFINNLDKVQICDKNVKSSKIDNNDKKQLILNAEKCLKNASEKCLSQLGKEFIPNPKINFIEQPQINYSLFTSTDFDAFIYLIYFVRNYNLQLPLPNKLISNKKKYELIRASDDNYDTVINDVFDNYISSYIPNPNLQHLSIYWHNKDNYFYAKNLKPILKKSSDIVFIYVTIVNNNCDHANGIIIDHERKHIIHFEPYGAINAKQITDFDDIFREYFKEIFPTFLYYAPTNYMKPLSFQHLSNETSGLNRKIGDVGGFCLAWTLWFLELYLNNRYANLKHLVSNSIKKIIDTKSLFSEYIRSYANKLTIFRTKLLNEINYPAERIFNTHKTHTELDYLFKSINNKLNKSTKLNN
jgi:hypothetical protein